MNTPKPENPTLEETIVDQGDQEHKDLLKAFIGTVQHFFGGWQTIFRGVTDGRNPDLIPSPLASLLCTGVLLFLFRLGSRRQIQYQLRENGPSQTKLETWFQVPTVPHGDTLNYAFQRLQPEEMHEGVCHLVENLIRKKVLYRWRLFDNFLVAVDGTGMLTFGERHCPFCLTQKLKNWRDALLNPRSWKPIG
jgi:hypothetical protein